jgi:hypothetical protein
MSLPCSLPVMLVKAVANKTVHDACLYLYCELHSIVVVRADSHRNCSRYDSSISIVEHKASVAARPQRPPVSLRTRVLSAAEFACTQRHAEQWLGSCLHLVWALGVSKNRGRYGN